MSIRDGGVVPRTIKAQATLSELKQRKKRSKSREKVVHQDRKILRKLLKRVAKSDGRFPLKLEELTDSQLALLPEFKKDLSEEQFEKAKELMEMRGLAASGMILFTI